MKPGQIAWLVGLGTFVCSALLGQAELLGEPWRHYVTVLSVIGTAVTGYMMQPHPNWNGDERRTDPFGATPEVAVPERQNLTQTKPLASANPFPPSTTPRAGA